MPIPHADFHEVWWIYSPINGHEWTGLRVAHFRKSVDGTTICVITGEIDRQRIGPRIWEDIQQRELWYKVKQIPVPTFVEVIAASLHIEERQHNAET